MRKQLLTTTVAAAALLVSASPASAQFASSSGCGGGTFISCAVWSAMINGNTLELTVQNTSGQNPANNPGSTFTTIGLGNIDEKYKLANNGFSFTGTGSWGFQNDINGFNGYALEKDTWGANSTPGNPAIKGLSAGNSTTFFFTFTKPLQLSDFEDLQIAFHDQGGFDACGGSSKAVFDAQTGAYMSSKSTTCAGVSTAPEPSTLILLSTGLLGFAGTGVGRRLRSRRNG